MPFYRSPIHKRYKAAADSLSAEFLTDIDQDWVDRLVGILATQKLVATR